MFSKENQTDPLPKICNRKHHCEVKTYCDGRDALKSTHAARFHNRLKRSSRMVVRLGHPREAAARQKVGHCPSSPKTCTRL